MAAKPRIFVSHTHADQALADAFRSALNALFAGGVEVKYSTSKELDGGIAKGEDWVRWIETQVRDAQAALILITPSSVTKPWVLWEAGAVQGVAIAHAQRESQGPADAVMWRRVLPIQFKLSSEEVPTPFSRTQVTDGLSRADMEQLFAQLVDDMQHRLHGFRPVEAGRRIDGILKEFLASAEQALVASPMMVTEAAVQEWIERIRELEQSARYSEIKQLHDWMSVAFGRERDSVARPIDARLHRRLAALYSKAKQPGEAAHQYELARQLAPRDIFVLRNLGKTYLDQNDHKKAREIIASIEALDVDAFKRNAENAALKARLQREQQDLDGAMTTLKAALERNAESYYLAELLAQVLLDRGEHAKGREIYKRVSQILERVQEHNIWTTASALTAALAAGEEERAVALARQLRALKPSPEEFESIQRGLASVASALGLAREYARILSVLTGAA